MTVYVLTFQAKIDDGLSVLGVYSSSNRALDAVAEWMEPYEKEIRREENGVYYSIYTDLGEYLITQRFVE